LVILKDAKFYLESKASFIDKRSIASFKQFLIAWLREYRTFFFRTVLWLAALALAKIHSWKLFSGKQIVFHYQTLFLLQICSLLDCS